MNKYKKYSLTPSISKKTKSNRLIFQIRIEFIKRNKSKINKQKSRTNSLSTSTNNAMTKAQSVTPSDAYSVVSVDSNSISSQQRNSHNPHQQKKRKLAKQKRRKKYKRRRKVNNVTDIEEENDKNCGIEEEEKSNIPLSKYKTNGDGIQQTNEKNAAVNEQTHSIQKTESLNAQKHKKKSIASPKERPQPPPIDYAQDTSSTCTHTHSVSHLSEDDNIPILSVNSSVRIIRRNHQNNGVGMIGYKELSHSCSDNLASSPIEREKLQLDKNNDQNEQNKDENGVGNIQNLDMITPQFPSCPSVSQPMPIPVVSSSEDENVQKQQNEESVSRNTQIIRNDKSRKERSNSFSHGPNPMIYGEAYDECRYEEEGSSAFYELSYDRNIKLSRRRHKNHKKFDSEREYSMNDEFESSKMQKILLCDDESESESNSLSISHELEMQNNEKNESEKENVNGMKNLKKKSRKSLQIKSNKKKRQKIPKRPHSQSVDIPKSKYQIDKESKHQKQRRKKEKKLIKKSDKNHSKKRKRAQSVKYKQQKNASKSKINDLSVCKNKVKNSVFRREKGHKKSFDDFEKYKLPQRAYSKSVTSSHSFNCLMLNENEQNEHKNDQNNDNEQKKDFSMTHSVTTTFKKIEEKLKDGLIEPGSTQYFEELDNAMIKLKKKHAKLAKKANKKKVCSSASSKKRRDRQRSATQKKMKRQVVRSKSVFFEQHKIENNENGNRKGSKHKKSKTVNNESLSARKKSKNRKQSEMNVKSKKHKLKKQEKELLGLSALRQQQNKCKSLKKSQKKKMKKKREYVMDSEDEEDSDLNKRKRIKVAKNSHKNMKKDHPFHLNSSRREGQKFGGGKKKKNNHSLAKLYDEEIHSNSSFREQRMALI